ncbi:MAG: hypothetical protein B7Y90_05200 [Alphaproteobacteria bacterium 32-64-14]|nr:MAG: hypothetical protein B7Y90_05200 [Alphaproteobacteria bacterium 32-64-14]
MSVLKHIWRFCRDWIAPFIAAGLVGLIVVGLVCMIAGMDRDVAVLSAIAGGAVTGVIALLIPPVRRWFADHAYLFDPGGGWT